MKANSQTSSLASRVARGFSLVEVTIATGIASFGIITLLGLLPAGMNMFRDAMNVTISSQIAQRLIREAVQTDYDSLVEVDPETPSTVAVPVVKPVRYYTDEGVELPSNKRDEAIFHAYTRIMSATNLPSSDGVVSNNSLATVSVQIALNPNNETIPLISGSGNPLAGTINPTTRIPFVTYNSHIARVK